MGHYSICTHFYLILLFKLQFIDYSCWSAEKSIGQLIPWSIHASFGKPSAIFLYRNYEALSGLDGWDRMWDIDMKIGGKFMGH